jgi:pilus assembly protein CpaB
MKRRTILLFAAALVAALGTALVFLYVKGADHRAEQRFETVEVLRAVAPIEQGESIEDAATNGKLALEAVSQGDLLPNHQTEIDQLKGQVATTKIYPGEQIVSDKFGAAAEALASKSALDVPKGDIAISVNLTDPGRVAGFLNPGSEVAIIFNGTDATGNTMSRVLLPEVTVLGVGSKKVTFAVSNGEIVLGLRTPDSKVKPGPGTTYANLFK